MIFPSHDPRGVGGDFYCSTNNLTDLVGGPERVGGAYDCRNNHLITLEGFPEHFGERSKVFIRNNPVEKITRLFFPKLKFNEYPKILAELIWALNDEMPINKETKEVSSTVLGEVFDRVGVKPPAFGYKIGPHYKLTD